MKMIDDKLAEHTLAGWSDGWRPIHTAPSDGRVILCFRKYPSRQVYSASADGEWWRNNTELLSVPTHWMPMPEPPEIP